MSNRIKKTIALAIACVILMFGFSFALVPLYRVVCKITGLNGGINVAEVNNTYANNPNKERLITIQFVATNNENLPWDFYPEKNHLIVHLNEKSKMVFYAKNNSHHRMMVQAVPSFAPPLSAKYFHKLECFCFRQQSLAAGEAKAMPVIFQIDAALPEDVSVITLAYTLFQVSSPSAQLAVIPEGK